MVIWLKLPSLCLQRILQTRPYFGVFDWLENWLFIACLTEHLLGLKGVIWIKVNGLLWTPNFECTFHLFYDILIDCEYFPGTPILSKVGRTQKHQLIFLRLRNLFEELLRTLLWLFVRWVKLLTWSIRGMQRNFIWSTFRQAILMNFREVSPPFLELEFGERTFRFE